MFGQFPQKHQGSPRCVIFHVARVKLLLFETEISEGWIDQELFYTPFFTFASYQIPKSVPSLIQAQFILFSNLSPSKSPVCDLRSFRNGEKSMRKNY